MAIQVRTDKPFGDFSPSDAPQVLNLHGQSEVMTDESIELHATMAKRWQKRFESATGIRMKPRAGCHRGTVFTRDELAKRVTAAAWQGEGAKVDAEKEAGGQYFPETREAMGVMADRMGFDLAAVEKNLAALGSRGARLLYPDRDTNEAEFNEKGEFTGVRTAMNNSTNSQALAIDYLQQLQFQVSNAGRLNDCVGQVVDLPNGRATLNIKKLGYAQVYLQAALTTAQYQNITDVSPSTDEVTFTPFKLATSMWATGEFEEDCFFPWIAAMEKAIVFGRGITMDHIRLRGHEEAGAALNINAFGGALALGSKDPRAAMNGFYGALWDGTIGGGSADSAKGVDMGGAAANLNMVPALRAKLNKYGLDKKNLRLIVGSTTSAQFTQDAKARPDTYSLLLREEGGKRYIDGCEEVVLADSVITNASSSGMPDYTLWNSEGNPVNLAADFTYTGTGALTAAMLVNIANWIEVRKRTFNWLVVRLPLADQLAIVGTERLDIGNVHQSVSEIAAYNLRYAA